MNKAAEELVILDDQARQDLASGKYRDQRRGNFGQAARAAASPPAVPGRKPPAAGGQRPRAVVRQPWSRSQEKLTLLYNEQGLRPADIAAKLGVSSHLVTQIILAAKNRGKS